MTFVITGATGQLGRLAVESLLDRGVAAGDIVATGRSVDKIADLADRGVRVVAADYEDPASLRAAFAGADRLLFVSASEPGRRLPQHRNVVDAAAQAGVGFVAYTSVPYAERSSLILAEDHRETERLLAASGLSYALLRNGWYLENYTAQVPAYVEHGVVLGGAGEGRVSGATRADLAAAAAEVLLRDGQEGAVYELGGDEAFTLADVAAAVSQASGREVAYQDLPQAELTAALEAAGVPEQFAAILADSDRGIADDELYVTSGDLAQLIGRPATTLHEAIDAAVRETIPA